MGILNVTPDSFSDGGQFADTEAALTHARKLIEQGADILDIGGESTRPKATPVSAEEECSRVLPVIEKITSHFSIVVSIDTMKPAVARAAIQAGASIVNDVLANRNDPEMWRLVAETGVGYIAMHMQGTPQTMQENPLYENVNASVNKFFEERLNKLVSCGVRAEQIALDVGIGFGKTVEHNLQLLRSLRSFTKWERPLVLGASRKSFLDRLLGAPMKERLPGSLACACWAVQQGAQIIRTHDVAETKQAIRMTEALVNAKNGEFRVKF
jgi:dihydropteroate synthase